LPFYAKYAAEYQDAKLEAFYQAAQALEECNVENSDQASALKWAFQAVNSRFWKQNPLGQKQVVKATSELVPIGDMMNHRDPPNVQMVPEDPNYVTFAYLGDDKESSMDKHPGTDEKTEVEKEVSGMKHNNGDSNIQEVDLEEKDLFITYGQPGNPHRFLVIFGFAPHPQYMPNVWSHLLYGESNPFAQDIDKMVIEAATGKVSEQVWDAILWELSEPPSMESFQKDRDAKRAKYKDLLADVLLSHVNRQLEEWVACAEKINVLDDDSPNKELIKQHNKFLVEAFSKVKNNLTK